MKRIQRYRSTEVCAQSTQRFGNLHDYGTNEQMSLIKRLLKIRIVLPAYAENKRVMSRKTQLLLLTAREFKTTASILDILN
jgi:hypothetical protein